MKIATIESMQLPRGVPVAQYEEADAGLKALLDDLAKGKLPNGSTPAAIVVGVCNKYSRQKDALVDFRDWLWTTIKARTAWKGFKTEKVKQGDTEVEVEALPEQKNINAFVQELLDNKFTHKEFPLDAKANEEQREAAIWNVFQKWTDEAAKTEDKVNEKGEVVGTQPLSNGRLSRWFVDLSVPERKSKPKTPPEYATKNAESVFSDTDKNGKPKTEKLAARLARWHKTMSEAHAQPEFNKNGTPAPVDFPDFRDTTDPASAKLNLAWAIAAFENWKTKANMPSYA